MISLKGNFVGKKKEIAWWVSTCTYLLVQYSVKAESLYTRLWWLPAILSTNKRYPKSQNRREPSPMPVLLLLFSEKQSSVLFLGWGVFERVQHTKTYIPINKFSSRSLISDIGQGGAWPKFIILYDYYYYYYYSWSLPCLSFNRGFNRRLLPPVRFYTHPLSFLVRPNQY